MHRHPQSQQQHYSRDLSHPPGTPQKSRRAAGGPGRRFFSLSSSGRTPRLHPIFLIPVFLCGTFLAPWFSTHFGIGFSHDASANRYDRSSLKDPVYRPPPPERDWQGIAPADAPPLKREDDYAGAFEANAANRRRRDDGQNRRRGGGRPASSGDSDEGDDELWEASLERGDDEASSSPFLIHGGLLYFRTSSTLIPPHNLERPFPIAQVRRTVPLAQPHVLLSDSDDSASTVPPPTPKDWLVPGELFAHAPGKRKHVAAAVAPAAAANGRGGAAGAKRARAAAAVPLRAPIPPAPPRQHPPVAQQRAAIIADAARKRQEPLRDERGHLLGPNAAAMLRAKKENRPFVPGTPAELLLAVQKMRQKKTDERVAKQKAEAAVARQKDAEERQRREAEQQREGMQPGVGLRRVDTDGHAVAIPNEDEDLVLHFATDDVPDDNEADDEDDEALLAAIRALSPAELADLTPDERALVAELEAVHKRSDGRQPAAQQPPAGAGRKAFREIAAEAEAAHAKELAPEDKPKSPKKPVFKGLKGMEEERKRQMAALAGQRKQQKRDTGSDNGPSEPNVQPPAAAPHQRVKRSIPEPEAPEPVVAPPEAVADVPPANSAATDAVPANDHNLARRASIPVQPKAERLHPITHLIAEAETKWEDMLRRQSQSLEDAVREYKRRYKMNPPTGFDSWWRYAMQNRVILVDEYDQIYDDILPFLSLPPAEFRKRVKSLKSDTTLPWHDFTFGFQIKDGSTEFPPGSSDYGAKTDLLDLLGEVAAMLPDLDLRINKGDEPMVIISGEARKRHEDLAKRQKILPDKSLFEILEPTGFSAWDSLCPHNSTARRIAQSLPVDAPSSASLRSFVAHESWKVQDLCEHPENRELNGFTAWSGPRPHLLYPIFSPVKTAVHGDLLLPYLTSDHYAEIGRDPLWEQKKHNQVLWRGETTGTYHAKGTGWRKTQRARLVQLANEISGETAFHIADTSASDSLRRLQAPSKDVLPLYFDVAYTGAPKQCSSKDSTCQLLQREYRFEREMLPAQENQYKYVLDVDANYASGNFKRLMSSRSLVFKSSIFPEWWSRRVMPWYHYIPIKSDYSDLVDAAAYFIGAPDGAGSHDRDAKRIAQQGKKWSQEHWREADMAAYMFRLLLEYARLLNRDEKDLHSMDYL